MKIEADSKLLSEMKAFRQSIDNLTAAINRKNQLDLGIHRDKIEEAPYIKLRCTFVNPTTGSRCTNPDGRHFPQEPHTFPFGEKMEEQV